MCYNDKRRISEVLGRKSEKIKEKCDTPSTTVKVSGTNYA